MISGYTVNGEKVPFREWTEAVIKQSGLCNMEITLPEDLYLALEEGESLSENDGKDTRLKQRLRTHLRLEHPGASKAQLDQWYKENLDRFQHKHEAYPIVTSSIYHIIDGDPQYIFADKFIPEFKRLVTQAVEANINNHVCMFGVDKKIKIKRKKDNNDTDEHEAVQSMAGTAGSSE